MSALLTAEEQKAAESAATYTLAPEGIYICRVAGVERWTTGTSLCWKFRVAKGQPYEGREFWTWTSLKAESIGRTKQFLATLGFGMDADPDDIQGTPCKVAVTIEARTDTGEPSNKVRRIFPYDGPELPSEYGFVDPFGNDDDGDDALI